MSEKHLPHKPDVLSSIPRSEGRGQRRGVQRSEEKCDLGRSGTEQGMTSVSQLSLDVFYRAFHRGPKSTDPEIGGRKLKEWKGRVRGLCLSRTATWAQEGNVIGQAR